MDDLSKCDDELGFTSNAVRMDIEGFLSKYIFTPIANVIPKKVSR